MKRQVPVQSRPVGEEPRVTEAYAWWGVALLAFLVLLLAVWRAGQTGYWYDELWSIEAATDGFGGMLERLRSDFHPPGYHALLWAWVRLLGAAETATRFLSALFVAATVPVTWWLGRTLGLSARGAFLAAGFLAAGEGAFFYAEETRPYAMLLFLASLTLLLLMRTRFTVRSFILVSLLGTATIYSHYAATFILLPGLLIAVLRSRDLRWLWLAAVWSAALVPNASLIYAQAVHFNALGWLDAPGYDAWRAVAVFLLSGLPFAEALLVLLLAAAVLVARNRAVRGEDVWLLLAPLTLAGVMVASHFVLPVFHSRYLVTLLPWVALTLGYLFERVEPRVVGTVAGGVLLLSVVLSTQLLWGGVSHKGEEWRRASALVRERPGNLPAVAIGNSRMFGHYLPDIHTFEADDAAGMNRWLDSAPERFWYVEGRGSPVGASLPVLTARVVVEERHDFAGVSTFLVRQR